MRKLPRTASVAVETAFIFCLAMAEIEPLVSEFQLSKERQSGASDQTDIRSVMIIDERKRDIIITTATTSNHSDDKDSRDATGNRSNASIESNRQTQSIDETRHRKTSDYDDDDDDQEAKISSRIASKIRSPQGRQLDSHRVSQTNRRRAKRMTGIQGENSGRMVRDDDNQRANTSAIQAGEIINDLPPDLRSKVITTDDAEQMVIRGFMKNGQPDPKWQSAYDSAKKEEREVLKRILSAGGQESQSSNFSSRYRSLRTGTAPDHIKLDSQLKDFFSKPSDALNAYNKMKMEETNGLDELFNNHTSQPKGEKPDAENDLIVRQKFQIMRDARRKLPDPLRELAMVTDAAELKVLKSFAAQGQAPPDQITKYIGALLKERQRLKEMLFDPVKEYKGLLQNYKSLRKGEPWEYLKIDNEFASFLNHSSPGLTAYLALKKDESESLDYFLSGSSSAISSNGKQESASTAKKAEPENQLETESAVSNITQQQKAVKKPDVENDFLVSEKYKIMMNVSEKLHDSLRALIMATDAADRKVLKSFATQGQAPQEQIGAYQAALLKERQRLKEMLFDPATEYKGLLQNYKDLRKGEPWEYVKIDNDFSSFFNKSSPGLTVYLGLKRDESDSLDAFLKTSNSPNGTSGRETQTQTPMNGSSGNVTSGAAQQNEFVFEDENAHKEAMLENERSSEIEEQNKMEERKKLSDLMEIIKQRSNMQRIHKERLNVEKHFERAEHRGEKQRREKEEKEKQMEENEENTDIEEEIEEEADDAGEESFAGKQDVDIVERVLRNVSESKRNDESTAPQNIEGNGSGSSASGSAAGGRRRSGVLWFSIIVGIIAEVIAISLVLFAYRNDVFKRSHGKSREMESEPLHPDRRFPSAATTFAHTTIQ